MTLDILNIYIMHLVERFEESSDRVENQSACMWERIYFFVLRKVSRSAEWCVFVLDNATYFLDNCLCMFPRCIMRVGV
jgi:hypothetical protein